uniref:cytochrome c oxidase subunit III n=1 Tax=Laemobothrion atrum TaxID=179170 RepID=UPI00257F3041|nr:cytochrome c oxidase subunit III [Laemobothrion atrum]WGU50352.1 cytochrome c oxidase subunit 3 [Laemobothrion atrum]
MMKSLSSGPYYFLAGSPWPLSCSVSVLNMLLGVYLLLKGITKWFLFAGPILLILNALMWFRDVHRESLNGDQGLYEQETMKSGMVLFILSEGFFFLSLFWGFFYIFISPEGSWPPSGVHAVDPLGIPLLGTIILMGSSVSATMALHFVSLSNMKFAKLYLMLTVLSGAVFFVLQLEEFLSSSFTMADGAFGSLFYILTGFHGLHVVLGTIMLLYTLWRMALFPGEMGKSYSYSMEVVVWYWHFVDVVWLFLYVSIYWGSW